MSGSVLSRLIEELREGPLSGVIRDSHERLGDATLSVDPARIVPLMLHLRDAAGLEFDMLTDLCAVDFLGEEPRFEVVYHLYSVARNHRLRVKVRVAEDACEIDSVKPVWASADWMEREVFDLYGISFRNHGDLRRILLYDEFEGHPLRKDYPKERRQPLVGPRN